MKNLFPLIYVMITFFFTSIYAQEKKFTQVYDTARHQVVYEGVLNTIEDNGFHKQNFFFSNILLTDYTSDMKIYQPLMKAFLTAKEKQDISMVIVGGIWWCPDTRDILSQLVFYTDSTHFNRISSIAVDRKKQSSSYEEVKRYNVERVPTLILFKDNKEIGRVVEYGRRGHWEKELTQILNKAIK